LAIFGQNGFFESDFAISFQDFFAVMNKKYRLNFIGITCLQGLT
jgi:hypothetical protein